MQQRSPRYSEQTSGVLDNLWKYLIQPEKVKFNKDRLGYDLFTVENKHTFRRDDDCVYNVHNERIEYTHYTFQKSFFSYQQFCEDTCVVYLHSHGSNRAEGLHLLQTCGELSASLCLFDFGGSGYSDGKYTSLGIKEAGECKVIIDELKLRYGYRHFILWGRSMGAVTAIIYASECPENLDFLVLDSPFSDLEELLKELVDKHFFLGEVFIGFFLYLFGDEIKKRIGFDISALRPVEFCPRITTNLAFVIARNDTMVSQKNINDMYEACNSTRKYNILIEGTHSSTRTSEDINWILDCIMRSRETPEEPYPAKRISLRDSTIVHMPDTSEGYIDFRIPNSPGFNKMQDTNPFIDTPDNQHTQRNLKKSLRESDIIPEELSNSEYNRIAAKLNVKKRTMSGVSQKENIPEQDNQATPINPNKQIAPTPEQTTPAELYTSKLANKLRESILGAKLNDSHGYIWDSLIIPRDPKENHSQLDISIIKPRENLHLTASQPLKKEVKNPEKSLDLNTIHEDVNISSSSKSSMHRYKTSKSISIFEDDLKPVVFDKLKVINPSTHKSTFK